jgi:hypothetical protein
MRSHRILPAGFEPGRFACLVRKSGQGRHGMQVVRDQNTSSLVLDLDTGGGARLCRGWRRIAFQDGPDFASQDGLEIQLGYSGRWLPVDEGVVLELERDDSVCEPVMVRTGPVAEFSRIWRLRCTSHILSGEGMARVVILACRLESPAPASAEDWPHLVPLLPEDPCAILGAGNGLEFTVHYDPVAGTPACVDSISTPAEPIGEDAWRQS